MVGTAIIWKSTTYFYNILILLIIFFRRVSVNYTSILFKIKKKITKNVKFKFLNSTLENIELYL